MFAELADLLEVEGASQFRILAYRNAARMVREHPKRMADLVAAGEDLSELPTIGKDLAAKIATIVETGRLPLLDEVCARTPRVLSQLMKVEGLGPKRVKILHETLGISSVEDLRRAAATGRIRELRGFGERTEKAILEGVERLSSRERLGRPAAEEAAEAIVAWLRQCRGVKNVAVAGSFRRRKETVADLDILATAARGAHVTAHLAAYDQVVDVVSQGTTRATVRLASGLQVDLRVVPQACYGAALHYFTGSKAHNVAVRTLALRKGLKLNEYGVFRGEERIGGRTEEEVFALAGLPYIEPELRENRGEIEAALEGRLPELIRLEDIRGDLHCHTHATDGYASIEDMAKAAAARGYEYVSINDHSRHVTIAHGLDEKGLRAEIDAIDEVNARLPDITVLKSIELDILEDGSLDLPDRILRRLDFTVCSVHYQFGLTAEKQTERILRAMDNPLFTILGHATGRLINQRPPYAIDLERVLRGAKERGCVVELNAHPDRLDITDEACLLAKEIGVRIAISTDSHRPTDLEFMHYGVDQARRGWLTAADVINAQPLAKLEAVLRERR